MGGTYTRLAESYFQDLLEQEAAELYNEIAAMPLTTSAEQWRDLLEEFNREYALSSRFALMRILCKRNGGSEAGFTATVDGESRHYPDITITHADSMTQAESSSYLDCLCGLAPQENGKAVGLDMEILDRAWFDAKERQGKRLTRDEALLLGHMLRFSLEEISWFLLRTFDRDDCLRYNQSGDLIEAYCFLTKASEEKAESLKADYLAEFEQTEKVDDDQRSQQWTKRAGESLASNVEIWKKDDSKTMDAAFKSWLGSMASGLDLVPHSARMVYRNLAACAQTMLTSGRLPSMEEDFLDMMRDLAAAKQESPAVRELLYVDGTVSKERCRKLAKVLLVENQKRSDSTNADRIKSWHVLTTLENGSLTKDGTELNAKRDRVQDILYGTEYVQKSDLLYLLWFTANIVWQASDRRDTEAASLRLFDFVDSANALLKAAQLSSFYPPHLMERSMLLSISSGGLAEDDPSVIYEYMLHSLVKSRNVKSRTKKKVKTKQ